MISLIKKVVRGNHSGAVVLMYHRVVECNSDPWDLCVTSSNFEDQMRMLKENFQVISMHHLADRLGQGAELDGLVSVTFDDGYQDNYFNAKPVLERFNIPATFFLTSLSLQTHKKFWWDELEQIILHTQNLPDVVNFNLGGKNISFLLGQANSLTKNVIEENRAWRYGDPLTNARIKLYFELWSRLKDLHVEERNAGMELIKRWSGVSIVSTPPLMSAQQIKDLTGNSLFDAGAHSVNHPALGNLSVSEQKMEIENSRNDLENIVAAPLSGFAFPYGHYNATTPVLVKNAGFRYAVTTEATNVSNRCSVFEIPRCQVKDVDGKTLLSRIHYWQNKRT